MSVFAIVTQTLPSYGAQDKELSFLGLGLAVPMQIDMVLETRNCHFSARARIDTSTKTIRSLSRYCSR